MHKPFAKIDTEIGVMTIFYNGDNQPMTAESESKIEQLDYIPKSFDDAADAIHMMYSTGPWFLEWID